MAESQPRAEEVDSRGRTERSGRLFSLKCREVLTKLRPFLSVRPRRPSTFAFFELPRELRDMIYDHALEPSKRVYHCKAFTWQTRVSAKNAASSKLLLVDHQFHAEYLQRAEKSAWFVVETCNGYLHPADMLPSALSYVRRGECHAVLEQMTRFPDNNPLGADHISAERYKHISWMLSEWGPTRFKNINSWAVSYYIPIPVKNRITNLPEPVSVALADRLEISDKDIVEKFSWSNIYFAEAWPVWESDCYGQITADNSLASLVTELFMSYNEERRKFERVMSPARD